MQPYIGSVPHALANLEVGRQQGFQEGHARGFNDGIQSGYNEGHQNGYSEGHQNGYSEGHRDGWDKAIVAGNAEILKADYYIKEHIREKTALQDQVDKLNQELRNLYEVFQSLEKHAEQLQIEVVETKRDLGERTGELNRNLWQYNRSVVFMHSVRGVLENLIEMQPNDAGKIMQMFAARYQVEVDKAIVARKIKMAPHLDINFEKALSKTTNFITEILGAANTGLVIKQDGDTTTVHILPTLGK